MTPLLPYKKGYRCNEDLIWAHGRNRYQGRLFPKKMVEMWGPPRTGDGLSEPYIHIAASAQSALEQITLGLLDTYLGDVLDRHDGKLCFAGGCALNVRMNRKIILHPRVKQLWVQPAAGSPLGAATWVAFDSARRFFPN